MKPSLKPVGGPDFAFPHYFHLPSAASEIFLVLLISFDVSRQLLRPKACAGLGQNGSFASGMSVPEAAMNEQGKPETRQHDVRPSRQVSPMQSVAIPCRMEPSTHRELRLGVLATDTRHKGTPKKWNVGGVVGSLFHGANFALFHYPVKGALRCVRQCGRDRLLLGGRR